MQSVRMVMRRVGVPNQALDVLSAAEVSEYIEYQYTSQGYRVMNTHTLGEVKDAQGSVAGYQLMFILVKDEYDDTPLAAESEKVKAKK